MLIIGLGHRKRTGKGTAAKFLVTEYKLKKVNIVRKGFADKLKDIAHEIYWWAGLQNKEYYDEHADKRETILPKLGKTPRQIWIELGNKLREIYQDTWIDYLLECTNADILIISDLRFPNEYKKIKDKGGYCFRIDRPSIPHTDDAADIALAEMANEFWDGIIRNCTDHQAFYFNVMDKIKPIIINYLDNKGNR